MMTMIIVGIRTIADIYILIIIAKVIVSYFLSPYNTFRSVLDRLVDPPLSVIRRFVPPLGMFDFSSLVLVILVQLVAFLLQMLLASFL